VTGTGASLCQKCLKNVLLVAVSLAAKSNEYKQSVHIAKGRKVAEEIIEKGGRSWQKGARSRE